MSMQVSRMSFMPVQRAQTPVFSGSKKSEENTTTSGEVITWLLSGNQNVQREGQRGFLSLSKDEQVKVILNIIKPRTKAGKASADGKETGKTLLLSTPSDRQIALMKALYAATKTKELEAFLWSLRGKTDLEVIGEVSHGADADTKESLAENLQSLIKEHKGSSYILNNFVTKFPKPDAWDVAAKALLALPSVSKQADNLAVVLAGDEKNASFVRKVLSNLKPDQAQALLFATAQTAAKQADSHGREVSRLSRQVDQLSSSLSSAESSLEGYRNPPMTDAEHAQMVHDMTR